MLPEHAYLNAFAHLQTIGPQGLKRILRYFNGDLTSAWQKLERVPEHAFKGTSKSTVLKQWLHIDVARAWERLNTLGIHSVSPEQKNYPYWLEKIHDPPYILYYFGALPEPAQKLLTVVGTRRISSYGYQAVDRLLTPVAQSGVGLVSGLAFGVDAAVHRLALKQGAYTLAVLGSGLDSITPATHTALAREIIAAGGCVASEFPPGTESWPSNFPRRNRLVAGFTKMTLVIEAAEKSGALITAACALDQDRDVAAVPGPITSPSSAGCLKLIKAGAEMIVSAEEILAHFGVTVYSPRFTPSLSEAEIALIKHLTHEPLPLDTILAPSGLQNGEVLALLSTLEIKGVVRQIPGKGFVLN